MSVRWRNYLWKGPRPVVGAEEIEKLENAWGVRLPAEYKEVVCLFQGMVPVPNVFNMEGGTNVFNNLLTLTAGKREAEYSIATNYASIRAYVPQGIFPFGLTPGGEYLCFDYRDAPEEPRIVLVTTEMYIYPVANSFHEFLEGLYEPADG